MVRTHLSAPYADDDGTRQVSLWALEEWRAAGHTATGDVSDVLVPVDTEPTVDDAPATGVNFVSQSWTDSEDGTHVRAAHRATLVPLYEGLRHDFTLVQLQEGDIVAQQLGFALRCTQATGIDEVMWQDVVASVRPDLWVPTRETLGQWAP